MIWDKMMPIDFHVMTQEKLTMQPASVLFQPCTGTVWHIREWSANRRLKKIPEKNAWCFLDFFPKHFEHSNAMTFLMTWSVTLKNIILSVKTYWKFVMSKKAKKVNA